MKKLVLWLLMSMSLTGVLPAQVRVEVVQDQEQFLPGEAIRIVVRITNRSGQTLHLGDQPDWLTFTVETKSGQVVSQTGYVPVEGEFSLESSKVAIKRLNLEPYFAFSGPDRYQVVAIVKIKTWDREISSQPKFFTINEGARLWQQDFGLPPAPDSTNSTPEIRKYILQQVNYTRGALRLYLRVTDAEGNHVYRVVPIGPLLSFSKPEPQLDAASKLHLMFQSGPSSCTYVVFNPDGDLVLRQTYDIAGTRPRLRLDDEGKIVVHGGARREVSTDIPPPKLTDSDDETENTSTNQVADPKPDTTATEKLDKPDKADKPEEKKP